MGCDVSFQGEALREDKSLSPVQPTDEYRRQVMEALGRMLDLEQKLVSVKINFILPAESEKCLDVVFNMIYSGPSGEQKEFETSISSEIGYIRSGDDLACVVLDRLHTEREKAAE